MGWCGPEAWPICKRTGPCGLRVHQAHGATVLPRHPPAPAQNSNLTCPIPNQGPPHIQDPAWPTPSRKQGQGWSPRACQLVLVRPKAQVDVAENRPTWAPPALASPL